MRAELGAVALLSRTLVFVSACAVSSYRKQRNVCLKLSNFQRPFHTGDLEQAKAAYVSLRPYYEEVEVLCESFPDIDTDIEARSYAFVSGDASCGADDPFARGQVYQGNHMIEALLYRSARGLMSAHSSVKCTTSSNSARNPA